MGGSPAATGYTLKSTSLKHPSINIINSKLIYQQIMGNQWYSTVQGTLSVFTHISTISQESLYINYLQSHLRRGPYKLCSTQCLLAHGGTYWGGGVINPSHEECLGQTCHHQSDLIPITTHKSSSPILIRRKDSIR